MNRLLDRAADALMCDAEKDRPGIFYVTYEKMFSDSPGAGSTGERKRVRVVAENQETAKKRGLSALRGGDWRAISVERP